ncbi:MAG: tetratricopeptide repeat protein [Acidobacteriota bacterium]|nr:tetratricopeptide repeat protein [Acidobacteriota bacterium]
MNRFNNNQWKQTGRQKLSGSAVLIALLISLSSSPAFAVNKDMVQLQTQVQELQDAVARLQQSNDERMGVMKDLVQQSADSVNKMAANLNTVQHQMQAQQDAQNGKLDQLSGQIQSLNDSIDEIKARLTALQKIMQEVQSQQQSPGAAQPGSGGSVASPAPLTAKPTTEPEHSGPAPVVRQGKPSADVPLAAGPASTSSISTPPVDDLYKTALGDYMSAKYALSSSEFGDVIRSYPDHPLAGNSSYYQGEIEYRGGHYAAAVKAYDSVISQFPDSNKVPASRLHKGDALIALKQTDAGVRELRTLIQRFPNSPEAMQARSKLSGMGVAVTPRH